MRATFFGDGAATARNVPDGVAGEDYGANRRKFVTDVGLPFSAVLLPCAVILIT
jgi:hypothetical protein